MARLESDLTASQQRANTAEAQVRDLSAMVDSGKIFNDEKLKDVKVDAAKERANFMKRIEDDAKIIKALRDEVSGLTNEKQRLN